MAGLQGTMMKGFGALNVAVYRASKGRLMGKVKGHPVLLLTVAGRTSGKARTTPVLYFEDAGRHVVIGSGGGSSGEPQWFRNLRRAERATVEVAGQRSEVSVAVVDGEERRRLWDMVVGRAPFFNDYATKSGREIPIATLTPTQ